MSWHNGWELNGEGGDLHWVGPGKVQLNSDSTSLGRELSVLLVLLFSAANNNNFYLFNATDIYTYKLRDN